MKELIHNLISIEKNIQFAYIINMAFDGSIIAALTYEFNKKLTGGRISKIVQSEKDELLLTIKNEREQYRLLISANPSLPVIYLTDQNKQAPLNAPAFCMLLRKHIQSGKIISITQPSMERIIDIEIEHYNEMGDLCTKILTIELMGKHSNIIFRDGIRILDSIRHVSALVSSVREVLPGRDYFIPFGDDKLNPFTCSFNEFQRVFQASQPVSKALYMSLTGISPEFSEEIIYCSGIDGSRPASDLNTDEQQSVYDSFKKHIKRISDGNFDPVIYCKDSIPDSFCPFEFKIFSDMEAEHYESVSALLSAYYSRRQAFTNMRQKTTDLRQIVQTTLSRDYKKLDLQLKQLKDTEKKDKYKVYGELLTAYGYSVEPKSTSFTTTNFYTGKEVTIPLDPALTAIENGKKFFDRYSKLKRTNDALSEIIEETKSEISHLESISASLDTVRSEADISEIRQEMVESGYLKGKTTSGKKPGKASKPVKSDPLHFVSSDGFHIYVGKNNYQNEYITFKLADGGDWWFHAKKLPGSHVIVKTAGKELPDRTFEEAASLAAHFSKAEGADKVEVDYIQRKHVKKPGGAKPGFVIYHTNYSMTASTDISRIQEI